MHAITYTSFGPARDVLTLDDLPTPDPAQGEVLVRLNTSGVNPSDIRMRAGGRPGVSEPPFPKIIPHSDGAGVIEAAGEGVDPRRIGQRVWIWNGQWQRPFGTAAEYISVPAAQAVPLPDEASFETGAVMGIPGLTACHAVLGGGPVADKTVLISGGAGTVGHLAVQIAAASGARVIATARGAEALESVRKAGAHHVFDYTLPDLSERILDATGGALVDRIAEVEFGMNANTNAEVIAPRGTIATFGSARDMAPTIPFYPLMFKAVRIDLLLIYLLTDTERTAATQHLTELLRHDALDVRIALKLPLANCADAHEAIETGGRAGSVILTI